MKPTREQFLAISKIVEGMDELTELWGEEFNTIYEQLGEDITEDLLTRSFDEMTSAWRGFRHAIGDLTNGNNPKPWVHEDCETPVEFDNVPLGYWATCPECEYSLTFAEVERGEWATI
jgi:uncharacterized heparinase superfamily protein